MPTMSRPIASVLQQALACALALALAAASPPVASAGPGRKMATPAPAPGALAASGAATAAAAPSGRCVDEDRNEAPAAPAGATSEPPAPPADPRVTLQTLVRDALARSQAVGATQLLAEAAVSDVDESKTAKLPQASVSGGFGPGGAQQQGTRETSLAQLRGSVTVSKLLYDGGRADRFTDWRTQLAESARYGHLSQQEQIALTAVTMAMERSRYRMQTQVYRQNARKMACLVEALETIVRADRGRASELVQARKSQQQAELSMTQSLSVTRQIEVRLRRLVGDGLPGVEGLATVFTRVPDLDQLVADVERSYDIAQLDAQVAASRRYAEVVAAGGNPQVSLAVSGGGTLNAGSHSSLSGNLGTTRTANYALGVLVNVPLYSPGLAPATDAASKRARAAQLQRADEVESRRFRVAELHEQTLAALDRVKRLAEVLRESEQVRSFTLQQWQQLGRRSLFDVMGAESEHYNLRVAYVNALHDVQELNANLMSLGRGVSAWLQ
jgi:outer membrane protein TolC